MPHSGPALSAAEGRSLLEWVTPMIWPNRPTPAKPGLELGHPRGNYRAPVFACVGRGEVALYSDGMTPDVEAARMLDQLLPQRIDNTYRGHKLALWLFALVVFMRVAMSLNSILNSHSVAISADGIPLDAFPPAAAQTIVSLFALLGLASLMICLLCILALARYRSMVPLMFTVLLLQYLGGRLVLQFLPIVRTGTPPGVYVNLALLALMIPGVALSLRSGRPTRSLP